MTRLRHGSGGRVRRLAIVVMLLCATLAASAQGIRRPRVDLTPLLAHDPVPGGAITHAALKVQLPEGLHANSNKPRDPSLIPTVLTVLAPSGVIVEEIVYPPATNLTQEGQPQPLAVFEREFIIGVRLKLAEGTAAGDLVIPGKLRYQACDELICYLPATVDFNWTLHIAPYGTPVNTQHSDVFRAIRFGTGEAPPAAASSPDPGAAAAVSADPLTMLDRFDTLGIDGGYLDTQAFLTFIRNAETGVKERGWFEGRGALAILLIVLVGGLALNLTPCVLPMIPINLAIIGAGAQSGSRKRGFLLGATYGLAMAIVYGLLGLIVVLTTGTFGAINASPWFNLGIALLFVALALAMFDVFEIDFSRFASGFRASESSRGTFLLAFTMGAIAALLAGACVAPVVIQVVLFSTDLYASGVTAALALPFLLGVGMAVPWPIAGAGIAALPKPGPWMVRVKQVFGVFILAMAVYYGYLAYGLFASRWVDAAEVQSSVAEKLKEGWHADLAAGLAAAERDGKPVLIDLWATWCKSCLTMDKTTLKDPEVTAALSNYVKIKYQAERPDEQPAAALMERFNAVGLPTYVILRPVGSQR